MTEAEIIEYFFQHFQEELETKYSSLSQLIKLFQDAMNINLRNLDSNKFRQTHVIRISSRLRGAMSEKIKSMLDRKQDHPPQMTTPVVRRRKEPKEQDVKEMEATIERMIQDHRNKPSSTLLSTHPDSLNESKLENKSAISVSQSNADLKPVFSATGHDPRHRTPITRHLYSKSVELAQIMPNEDLQGILAKSRVIAKIHHRNHRLTSEQDRTAEGLK